MDSSRKEKGTTIITETTTRKVCSRSKEHLVKSTTHVTERKHVAHSGVKFIDSKKLTVVKPFSFDTGPKIKKEKVLPLLEKPSVNQKDTGRSKTSKEHLKITKEVRSRSASPGKFPKSPAKNDTIAKSPCNGRASFVDRLASTPTISSAAKSKTLKFPDGVLEKSPRKILKTTTTTTTSAAQPVKEHVHFSNSNKKVPNGKESSSSSGEKCKSGVLKEITTAIPCIKVTQPSLNDSELKSEPTSNGVGTSPESDSPTGSESNLPNGIHMHCEYSETKVVESTTTKNVSKIPRKKFGAHSGLKFHPSIRKETIPQPFSFDKRCSNSKKENIQIEANQMKIENLVNN